jgi:hypothetical protein
LAWRLPALRLAVLLMSGITAGLIALIGLLESNPGERVLGLAWLVSTMGASVVLMVWLAWRPVQVWQRLRASHPTAVVLETEVRILNWDVFKQKPWYKLTSPWNGPYHRALLMMLPDRVVLMGLKGVPWPSSPNALPVHPVLLLPPGASPPPSDQTQLPHAHIHPIHDRSSSTPHVTRYRIDDPTHDGGLTWILKSPSPELQTALASRFLSKTG